MVVRFVFVFLGVGGVWGVLRCTPKPGWVPNVKRHVSKYGTHYSSVCTAGRRFVTVASLRGQVNVGLDGLNLCRVDHELQVFQCIQYVKAIREVDQVHT